MKTIWSSEKGLQHNRWNICKQVWITPSLLEYDRSRSVCMHQQCMLGKFLGLFEETETWFESLYGKQAALLW